MSLFTRFTKKYPRYMGSIKLLNKQRLLTLVIIVTIIISLSFLVNNHFFLSAVGDTDNLKRIIPLEKIVGGGPLKDGIPSIDNPKFVEAKQADFLSDSEIVIGIELDEIAKAYPLQILVWHEIVNDRIGDIPLAVTYCPLCYSSIVYIRKLGGKTIEFGTSGRLYKNDLVMYDRQPGSIELIGLGRDLIDAGNLWSQMLGQAIVGDKAGEKLTKIPSDVMKWRDWRILQPNTLVLSTDTGYARSYGIDPYDNYYTSEGTLFPISNVDNRIFQKEVILGIEYDGKYKAYPVEIVRERLVVNDIFDNRGILLFKIGDEAIRAFEAEIDGQKLTFRLVDNMFIDEVTGSVWNKQGFAIDGPLKGINLQRAQGHIAFWFAWADFYPKTEVYE
jgi:hypothetical protein